jgi:hypothetical protein
LADGNLLSNKIKINLHMLGALMLNGVGEEVHDTDVVTVDKGAPRRQGLELVEQLMQPSGLSQRHDTQPQHWSERRWSAAWLTRKPSCPPGTPHSLT